MCVCVCVCVCVRACAPCDVRGNMLKMQPGCHGQFQNDTIGVGRNHLKISNDGLDITATVLQQRWL